MSDSTSKSTETPELWLGKARALLRPSPYYYLASTDARERERLDKVDESLGPPTDDERELIERCLRDAQDATVSVPRDALERAPRDLVFQHPLDPAHRIEPHAREESSTYPHEDFYERERELLQEVSTEHSCDAPWYRRLWYQVMDDRFRFPGSMLVRDHSVQAHRTLCAALYGARRDGGQAALLYLHVGPVQRFIQASRRTHDFWIASFTLGYLTFQGARALAEELGPDAVIMPDLATLPLAQKLLFDQEVEKTRLLRSSLANHVLAVVPEGRRANDLAKLAAIKIREKWDAMAGAAREQLDAAVELQQEEFYKRFGDRPLWEGWKEQLEAHLDIEAVVQPWPEDRDAVRQLFAGLPTHEDARPENDRRSWWLDAEIEDGHRRTGFAYGALFDRCHRVRAAGGKGQPPAHVPGDHRPKCSQTGEHEQMGPRMDESRQQLRRSRQFFEQLSEALNNHDSGRESADDPRDVGSDVEPQGYSFQLTRGEGLSAVALAKRLAPSAFYGNLAARANSELELDWSRPGDRPLLRFPAVVTIAAAPLLYCLHHRARWLSRRWTDARELRDRQRSLDQAIPAWLNALDELHRRDCLHFTPPGNLLPGLDLIGRIGNYLDHDGQWFHESTYVARTAWQNRFHRAPSAKEKREGGAYHKLEHRMPEAGKHFRKIGKALDMAASPYYALIVLDGDRMGQWLTGRHKCTPRLREVMAPGSEQLEALQPLLERRRPLYPALHAELSRRLGKLAQALYDVVEERHLGRVVYSGGDDIVAFVPLATALPCLRAIEREIRKPEHLGGKVTVSAGLAVVHMRTPMSRALALAREAESTAKQTRNRFVIAVDKRSGETHEVALPWRIENDSTHGRELDVIAAIMDVLRHTPGAAEPPARAGGDGDEDRDGHPLSRVDVAYRLAREAPALAGLPAEIFFDAAATRIESLLAGAKGPAPRVPLVRALLKHGQDKWGEDRAHALRRVIDVLLLIRFLLREEHGIDTRMLLDDLVGGTWPND